MTSTVVERSDWTAAGADTAAKNTYASIQAALRDLEARRSLDIFLQGSYANSTKIRADSDVDIVVMTRLTMAASLDRLSPQGRLQWNLLPAAEYSQTDLRAEIQAALSTYYGSSRVHSRNKCIQVDKEPGYVDADVVPCVEYRWYRTLGASPTSDYAEGTQIFPARGGVIVNFPKEHIRNGHTKNRQCLDRYKPTVRQMKHLRNRAVREGRLADGEAPGYLLECMTYNVPPEQFAFSDSERLSNVVLWLKFANKQNFLSCDRIHRLFADDPGGFSVATAQKIVDALWEAF